MFELIYVFYFLPKRIKGLAQERGRSALAWSIIAIVAWFGAEILVIIVFTIGYAILAAVKGWQTEPGGLFFFSTLSLLCPPSAARKLCVACCNRDLCKRRACRRRRQASAVRR